MITVKLTGGLGNQLFQYALGRNLAQKNADELFLDASEYRRNDQLRNFVLDRFQIEARVLQESASAKGMIVKEKKEFSFDEAVLDLKGDLILQGYWNNEEYVKGIIETLRTEIILKPEHQFDFHERSAGFLEKANSVAIHIRRGDYVKNPNVRREYDICGKEYYHAAMQEMERRVPDAHFLVFSDDIAWARRNLRTTRPIIFLNGPDYEDFVLMLKCRHIIMPNSTFSWWAAYLDSRPGKIVIAPAEWTRSKASKNRGPVPDQWVRLSVTRRKNLGDVASALKRIMLSCMESLWNKS